MKKSRVFLALAMVAAAFASCNPVEPEVEAPVIELASENVRLTAEGEAVQVVFNIANPVEGVEISVVEDADWLEVNASKPRILEFSATKNESDKVREAEVTVSYEGAENKVIKVSQDVWVAPITITVQETDATTATFSVAVADENLTWVAQCVGKEWWEAYGSDDEVFAEDMSYFQWAAGDNGLSLPEYLAQILLKGSKEGLRFKGLDPLSDYVIYVYGLTTEGEPTTSIYSAEITTLEPYDGPITFDIQVTEENHVMDINITPSHDGVAYYWNIMDEASFNEWGSEPGQVFQDYIDYEVDDYLYWGDIYDPSEYFEWFSTTGFNNSQFESIAGTRYIIFASKWDEDCKLVGDAEYVWFETEPVEPSDNQITLTLSNPSQSSFDVTTTTTNDDPYVILAEPSAWCGWGDMTDQQIYDYVMAYYGTWFITDYICQGDLTEARFYNLDPGTEYTVVAFGYEAGSMTTAVQKATITTLDSGSPSDCTFDFEIIETTATSVYAMVTPSDAGFDYYWFAYDVDATAEDVKEDVLLTIEDWYYGDYDEFAYYELSRGASEGEILYLNPMTEYKLAAVIMGENGEFLSDVHFSEPFTTSAMEYSDVVITASFDKYYDGDALAAADPAYERYQGMAVLPVSLSVVGDYAEMFCAIYSYEEGLDDPDVYPDTDFHSSLYEYYVWSEENLYLVPWDTELMLAAMATDYEGRCSHIYREKFSVSKDGASPVEDMLGVKSAAASKSGSVSSLVRPESKIQVNRKKTECSDLFSTEVVNARKAECKARKDADRKSLAQQKLQLRKKAVQSRRFFVE